MSNPYAAPGADLTAPQRSGASCEPAIFSFSGRIGRVRYLAFSILYSVTAAIAGGMVLAVLAAIKGASGTLFVSVSIMVALLVWAVGFIAAKRRLNDMNHSSWLALLMMIPYLNTLVWLWLACARGDDEENQYGLPPGANSGMVVAAAFVLPLAFAGIVAAVAIPAYADYVKRARAQGSSVPVPVERAQ